LTSGNDEIVEQIASVVAHEPISGMMMTRRRILAIYCQTTTAVLWLRIIS